VNRFCRIVSTWLSAAFWVTGALAQTTPHCLIVNNNLPEGNFATPQKWSPQGLESTTGSSCTWRQELIFPD